MRFIIEHLKICWFFKRPLWYEFEKVERR